MEFKHKSVLLQETIDNLNIRPDGIYVDGTLGGGGHSYEIASRLSSKGRLIGIDQDEAAIAAAGEGQVVKVDGINGEFGFVTEPMTERAFEDAKDKVSVISRIRIDDTKLQ